MAEGTDRNEWSQRIERALSGTTVEQVRELLDRLRDDLAKVATRDDLAQVVTRDDLAQVVTRDDLAQVVTHDDLARVVKLDDIATLASREDLVRGLEAVAAAQQQKGADAPAVDPDAIEQAVAGQAERILGGFAQRVGQLQTAIMQTQEALLERIERLEDRIATGTSSGGDGSGIALEQLRDELRSLEVSVRTEIDAGFRARDEKDSKEVDALGLRVTNLSMSVTQAIDGVRAQVAGMQERAERLEAEQAAILGAIRSEVAGIGTTVAREVTGSTQDMVRSVNERVDAIAHVGERLALLDQVLERMHALDGLDQNVTSAIAALKEPLAALGEPLAALRELSDQAIQLGAIPQIEAQLRSVEDRLNMLGEIGSKIDALPGHGDQLEALAPVTAAIDRLQREVAAIPSLREQVRELAESSQDGARLDAIGARLEAVSGAMDALTSDVHANGERIAGIDALIANVADNGHRLDVIAARLDEQLSTLPARIDEQLSALPARIDEQLSAIAERVDAQTQRLDALARLDDVAQMLAAVGARLNELPDAAASTIASRVDAVATELWTIVERLPLAVEERIQSMRDRIEQRLEGLHVDLGDVERVREIVDGMLTTARANEVRLTETAAQVDAVATEMREEVSRALGRVTVRLDGVEAAVARTILDVRGALEEGARTSSGAIDGVAERMGLIDRRLDALDEAAASVREQLAALPAPEQISEVVRNDVNAIVTGLRASTEGRMTAVERDLAGVGTNVNEIWMRARGIAKVLEQLNEALERQGVTIGERIDATDARMGQVLDGEQRTAQRLTELEQRFIAAVQAVEAHRDKLAVQAFEAMVERLARDERRLAKRLRGMIGRRKRELEAPDARAATPAAPPKQKATTRTSVLSAGSVEATKPAAGSSPRTEEPTTRAAARRSKTATAKTAKVAKAAKKAVEKPSVEKNLPAAKSSSKAVSKASTRSNTASKKKTVEPTERASSRASKRRTASTAPNGAKRTDDVVIDMTTDTVAEQVTVAPTEAEHR